MRGNELTTPGDPAMITEEERRKVFYDWNDTRVRFSQNLCIHELIESQVQKTPEATALEFNGERLTYNELNSRANQLARYLQQFGVGPDTLVGISVHRSIEMIVGLLGILKSGGAYVPLDPNYPQGRLRFLLADSQVSILITEQSLVSSLPESGPKLICLDTEWKRISQESEENFISGVKPTDLAYVIYTSGSTGKPKGVMIQHNSLVNFAEAACFEYKIQASDYVLQFASISFDAAAEEIFPSLINGAKLVVRTDEMVSSIHEFLESCREIGVTVLDLPTAFWHQLTDELATNGLVMPESVRLTIIGGERALPERWAAWQQYVGDRVQLFNTYGPTEATVVTTAIDLSLMTKADNKIEIPIGKPIQNVQVYVLDQNEQPVPIGTPGELHIGGIGLARGYLNQPELTEEKFIANPFSDISHNRLYKTGDLVRYLPDGNIEFLGRVDDQVKIRGYRIELGEVDAAVRQHPALSQNVTIAREDIPGERRLVSYVIPRNGEVVPPAGELREFLRQILPEYMIPARFVVLDKFPLTTNNKINRQALPIPDRTVDEVGTIYEPPQNQIQMMLVEFAASILNLDRIGIHDNFFDLGGNSLLATRLISEAREITGLSIPLHDFFSQPTIAGLSMVIETLQEQIGIEKGQFLAEPSGDLSFEGFGDEHSLLSQSNLTRNQFLMWMGQRINTDVALYNVIQKFTIHGPVDVQAFKLAFQSLIDHHDALRTIFVEVEGVPQQVVQEKMEADLELIDFSREYDPEKAFSTWIESRKKRTLALDKQLFDSALIQLAPSCSIWYLCQHHIITDALSEDLIFKRMSKFYALALSEQLDDVPMPPQYSEYVKYEQDFRRTDTYRRDSAYWNQISQKPFTPTEFFGKTNQSSLYRTNRSLVDLGSNRSARLREIAHQSNFSLSTEDLSLFTIFATLLFTTIHRINGEKNLRLGTPFHGRPTVKSMEMVGLFIEMGLLEVALDEDETFTSLIEKVKSSTLTGLSHIQPGISSAAINRAYDVVLNFIQPSFTDFAGIPVTYEWVDSGYIDKDHAMRLQVTNFEGSGNFSLAFDLKEDIFGDAERAWLIDHFLKIVDAFISDPMQPISAFSLQSLEEYHQLVVDFNNTDTSYPREKTVVQLFEVQAAKTPEAIAVVCGDEKVTYAELNARANQLAYFLRSQGVGPEHTVAVCMERSIEVLIAIWGVLKAGGAYIPIDPTYPAERIAFMLADAQPAMLLLANDELPSGLDLPPAVKVANLTALNRSRYSSANPEPQAGPENLVYIIYTSGSTGRPKGTLLEHRGLQNYVCWAREVYQADGPLAFPLYSSLAFDLTVTSIFVPLTSGGQVVVYRELREAPGMEILSVFEDNAVDIVKLTPAHLGLVREMNLGSSRIRKLIVGGEDFKTDLARSIDDLFGGEVEIFNEYGPTEAVVGCMIHRFDPAQDTAVSVPIGRPAANARIYLLDEYNQPVPPGVVGEMVISSDGVARGYLNQPELTAERFAEDPFRPGARFYRSGDAARWNEAGQMVFLGRRDHQVKIGGARVELGEIESRLASHSAIHDVVVSVVQFEPRIEESEVFHCTICGLPSNYPDVTFTDEGVCSLCVDFDTFRDDVFQYFKTMEDLQAIVAKAKVESRGEYDCMMLYSGGKDSTYVLSQLVEMGLRVLAFSLDNGYISEEAKENVRRVTDHLGVDLVFATTPHMKAIFADSLERFSNVCQGCYKAIYTLSMNLARQKGIKYIFTGLSRGQLFETRLDELFRHRIFDVQQMDSAVLEARKVYHRVDDAVSQLLDVRLFADDRVFDEIQFVDFFRYTDVELDDLYDFLSTRVPWIRPQDTGRSTNCLINEAGIFVHMTEQGYHNYALPYSWDVRLGHKTREEAMEELDDDLRLPLVQQMLDEVGYSVKNWRADLADRRLAAYYVTDDESVSISALREYLAQALPPYMVPSYFVRLQVLPLTANGKVKRQELPNPLEKRPEIGAVYVAPQSMLEIQLADLWSNTLKIDRIGIHDNFFDLGGASIPAVQIVARISDKFDVAFPISSFFENPTIAGQSLVLEELLIAQIESLSDEEVAALLAEMED